MCLVIGFAFARALRQLSEYCIGLSLNEPNPETALKELVSFLPLLAYDGRNMTQIDAGGILDISMAGTSATLVAMPCCSGVSVIPSSRTRVQGGIGSKGPVKTPMDVQ